MLRTPGWEPLAYANTPKHSPFCLRFGNKDFKDLETPVVSVVQCQFLGICSGSQQKWVMLHNKARPITWNQLSGVQRSGDARGDSLIGCPLLNSRIEQWRMVVIVTGYTLLVTSQYDFIFTFANQRFGEVWHSLHIQGPGAAVGQEEQ